MQFWTSISYYTHHLCGSLWIVTRRKLLETLFWPRVYLLAIVTVVVMEYQLESSSFSAQLCMVTALISLALSRRLFLRALDCVHLRYAFSVWITETRNLIWFRWCLTWHVSWSQMVRGISPTTNRTALLNCRSKPDAPVASSLMRNS